MMTPTNLIVPSWLRYGAVAAISALVSGAGAWQVQEWRLGARISVQAADIAKEREDHAVAARTADADQRLIEFSRMEVNAHVTYQTQQRLDAAAAALRDREFAIVGLRNALATAESRSRATSSDPAPPTGADDPATLRTVVRECAAEYSTMVENAVLAGAAVRGLQEYTEAMR
ncbi:MAG: hypothetical protein ABS43_01840 [Bordetella sp. SCN 67-23]|nr:hypothetical protein [Burkholderiales bacterium]ODS76312.1 MAG: hypothetical protein ABS43_01840 [Bordetella sp. SCN 67-23]OJW90115.1 MAG: hypothetical protein BGO71_27775 [Burkholderiales bacterium 67-32]